MKPDYKNWLPKPMLVGAITACAACLILAIVFALLGLAIPAVLLGAAFLGTLVYSAICAMWYTAFSYDGKRQLSRQIISGVSDYVKLPDGGTGLDVGCGSGALAIACAKKNPNAKMVGIDSWGKKYDFSKALCDRNAKLEGVGERTEFLRGDACSLPFADEAFDCVTSNYCYHNIPSDDRQAILLETLRVLKKGGTFAIHDIFSRNKYGDMDAFLEKLKEMGFASAELIDTANGKFMTKAEAKRLLLANSALLIGTK